MATELFMPQLGLTMTEGTVVRWLKKVGDPVKKGEAVFEVETDKVVQEAVSLEEGTLARILVEEGKAVPVGTVIGYLAGAGESLLSATAETAPIQPQKAPELASASRPAARSGNRPTGEWVRASPAARRLAEKLKVELGRVQGTGPSGRIVEMDVRRAAEDLASAPTAGQTAPTLPPSDPTSPYSRTPITPGERVELRGARKVVAERMAQSFSSAPHFYLTVEVDAGALAALQQQLVGPFQKRHGVKLTVTDLLVKAVAVALKEHPYANAAWGGDAIELNASASIGVAVASEDGLVVPVIQGADGLSLGEIAQRRASLVEKARLGRLTLPELEGGSFTLSNLGMFGIDLFQAIVNPPQSAILAVGRIKERPAAVDGQLVVRPTMFMTLSSDHRILDGAMAAQFLARVVELIERPFELLLGE